MSQGLKKLKKIYAVVNLPCKKFDGRGKRVYNMSTLKNDIHGEIRYIPLR